MKTAARNTILSYLLLLLLFLGTVIFRLGSLPFSGSDEPRYARIAYEMLAEGRWVTPTLEGRPWLEKPPLYYWITIPIYRFLGASEATARLGPAICALLTAAAVVWLGARLWSLRAGFLAAAILLSSLGFAGFARSASTDMPMTACVTGALAILAVAAIKTDSAAWMVWLAYVLLAFAVLAKGPVALILVGGIAAAFWCFDERGGSLRRWKIPLGLFVTAAVALPWFLLAFRQNGFAFIAVFFVNHNLARYVSDIHHHTEPFYYYVPVLLALFFPWSGWLLRLAPESIGRTVRGWRRWNRSTLFLLCWILFPVIFFSISRSKLAGYLLPVLPPMALLAAARFDALLRPESGRPKALAAPWFHLGLSAAAAAGAVVVFQKNYGGNCRVGIALAAATLIPGMVAFFFGRAGNWSGAWRATLAQGLLLPVAVAQFAFPVLGQYHSARDIASQIAINRSSGEPAATFRFFHHTLHYYTGYQIAEDLADGVALERFALAHPRFLLVTEVDSLSEVEKLKGYSATLLSRQGKLCLLRVAHN